jgi:outer membrane immunogenic protein
MRNELTSGLAGAVFSFAASGVAFAADMPIKAPPPPVWSWTGFYAGPNVGYGWTNNAATLSPNDPLSAALLAGTNGGTDEQPLPGSNTLRPNGAVGGLEAGYNWQASPNWLLGIEADFSFTDLNGQAAASSIERGAILGIPPVVQTVNAQQTTDWYGTVRGRVGWLATPSLLIFGTGGFAYGRVADSANYLVTGGLGTGFFTLNRGGFNAICTIGAPCITGSSTAIQTGWTAGAGAEWMFTPHLSLKAEYQFVNLGTQIVTFTALVPFIGGRPTSFNAAFCDQIQIVRVGLNWHL